MSWSTSLPVKAADNSEERWLEAKQLLRKKLVGKWQLERVLGVGATSSVFEAVHNNGHRVAIKILHPELAFNRRVRQRFLREGYLANRVEHPGVVAVIDDGTTSDGIVFLVLELLAGQSLAHRVIEAGGRLEVGEVLRIADDVLEVLEAAHARHIVHRDIKPANIFLTRSGATKVLDFGLARLCDVAGDVFQSGSGGLLGTPAYMAPEQARGAPGSASAQTDVWCLGATMFRLLSGRTVHSASTVNQLIIATATEAAPPLLSVVPGLSEDVARVVDRALKLDPADRWQSAAQMKAAIAEALSSGNALSTGTVSLSVEGSCLAEIEAGLSTLPEPETGEPVRRRRSSSSVRLSAKSQLGSRSRLLPMGGLLALFVLPLALWRYAGPALFEGAPTTALEHLPVVRSVAASLPSPRAAMPDPLPVAFRQDEATISDAPPTAAREVSKAASSEPLTRPRSVSTSPRGRAARSAHLSKPARSESSDLPDSVLDHRE